MRDNTDPSTQRLDHRAIARACVEVSRNWKNPPPNQRSRPVQSFELIEEASKKGGESRKLVGVSAPTGANPRSPRVMNLDIRGGGAGVGVGG